MAIRIHILVLVPFIALATIGLLLVLRRRGHPASRVLFIAVFAAYLTGVASFVFFPITLDPHFIEVMRRDATAVDGFNLVPFRDLSADTTGRRQLIGNVLLGIPFGFGLPFLIQRSTWILLAWGVAFALAIELVQLLMNVVYGFAKRGGHQRLHAERPGRRTRSGGLPPDVCDVSAPGPG